VTTNQNYDYLLGGKDHYAADRAAAEAWMKVYLEQAPAAAGGVASPRRLRRHRAAV
jgi:hypothetical protein